MWMDEHDCCMLLEIEVVRRQNIRMLESFMLKCPSSHFVAQIIPPNANDSIECIHCTSLRHEIQWNSICLHSKSDVDRVAEIPQPD